MMFSSWMNSHFNLPGPLRRLFNSAGLTKRTDGIRRLAAILLAIAVAAIGSGGAAAAGGSTLVYIGTYTGAKSKGLSVSRLDTASGRLSAPELAAETKSPSFLAIHPAEPWLYAVGEMGDVGPAHSGSVTSYVIDRKTRQLKVLNQQPSGGGGPCHLALDHAGKCLLAANYGSGSVAALALRPDGSLGEPGAVIQHRGSSVNPQLQNGPHAHFITTDPANHFALACDLGLDQVLVYRFDASRMSLTANDPAFAAVKPGSGPRHLAFHPNGRVAYVINEMASTVTAFAYDAKMGTLHELQTISTLPPDFKGQSACAEIQIHPWGKFRYGSNRGHDSIAVFTVAAESGELTRVEVQPTQGKSPRHFGIDPSGRWLLAENQGSDSIVVFRLDGETGKLSATGERIEGGAPGCVAFTQADWFGVLPTPGGSGIYFASSPEL